jgi:hypothetical protein
MFNATVKALPSKGRCCHSRQQHRSAARLRGGKRCIPPICGSRQQAHTAVFVTGRGSDSRELLQQSAKLGPLAHCA